MSNRLSYGDCIEVSPQELKRILRNVEKDGIILRNKNHIYVRFIKTEARYTVSGQAAFSTPFIGCFRGSQAYVKKTIFNFYMKERSSC